MANLLNNKAKELLFQDKQITNYTIAACIPEFYCEVAKHCDCIWFEMHSTMSYDEVCRMIFRFGKTRVDVGVDVENLFNTSYPTTSGTHTNTASATRRWAVRGITRRRSTRRGSRG